jgi:hypothetical protein
MVPLRSSLASALNLNIHFQMLVRRIAERIG